MLTNYYTESSALERLRRGAAGGYLDGFTDWLGDRHYAMATIRAYVPGGVRFSLCANDA